MKRSDKMCSTGKFNIAVITTPFYTAVPQIFLANLLDILEPLSNKIYVITGFFWYKPNTKIHITHIKKDDISGSLLRRILRELLTQPRVTFNLLKISKKIDIVIFFLGTRTYLLPLVVAKLLNKKVVLAVTGSESKGVKIHYGKKFFGLGRVYSIIVGILERIDFHLSDQITVESEGTIDFQGLNKFREKIATQGARYIDTNLFTIKKELKERKNLVGYIGRFSKEKGVMNFAKAMPLISKLRPDLGFSLVGDGPLQKKMSDEIRNNNLSKKVETVKWISHDKIADHFNELKLFVLPSYSEGLPTAVLEAMACGTPVLATPVGAISDLIKDGITGFIMENNTPECIMENVMRAIEHLNLDEIVKNAREQIGGEYTYKVAVERYKDMLSNLGGE